MPAGKATLVSFAILAVCGRVAYYIVTPLWLDHFREHDNGTSGGNGSSSGFPSLGWVVLSACSSLNIMDPVPAGGDIIGSRRDVDGDGDVTRERGDANSTDHEINVIFVTAGQYAFSGVIFGLAWLLLCILGKLGFRKNNEVDGTFSKKPIIIMVTINAMGAILFNFALSGTRTPLYLQAILSNCNIPIQFITRFLLLRRRPTWIKLLCAVVVALCEFVCLIPSIFPKLEPDKAHQSEGGSTGAWKFLWPMFMVLGLVPFAIANNLMEKSVKVRHCVQQSTSADQGETVDYRQHSEAEDTNPLVDPSEGHCIESGRQVSLVVFLFWWSFLMSIACCALFWTDLIPKFGTSKSLRHFALTMKFSALCLFGQAQCGTSASLLGWLDFTACCVGAFAFAGLMRYSEGTNFLIIILTLRTPLVFLFWALFQESPFRFSPHAYLSTWLSIGAIAVMIPAVIIYDLAPAEKVGLGLGRSQSPAKTSIPSGLFGESQDDSEDVPENIQQGQTF